MTQTTPLISTLTPTQHLALRAAAQHLEPALAAPPTVQVSLTRRGNTYTSLNPALHGPLYALLLAHCHTPRRLALENHPLPSAAPPTTLSGTNPTKPRAIVLDCEMAGAGPSRTQDEIISLSVIDFFTGATLLHTLVCPTKPVTDWRTAVTGVTAGMMAAAVARGEALRGGREAAVAALWGVVGRETVVVGHAVGHDLRALGVGFGRVVDSGVLAAEAAGTLSERKGVRQPVGLQRLCRELVGVRIREGGGGRHDSLEDVLATREVVVWCLRHPEELRVWAAENWRVKEKGAKGKRGTGRRQGGARGGGISVSMGTMSFSLGMMRADVYANEWDDEDDEMPRWKDEVDWDTWPKSPPDWSD